MEAWVAWLMGLFRTEHIEFALFAEADEITHGFYGWRTRIWEI